MRILLTNTGTGPATDYAYRLEYASSSCTTWTSVLPYNSSDVGEWMMDLSEYLPDGASLTNVAGGIGDPAGIFAAGRALLVSNQTAPYTLTNGYFTEHEFALRSTSYVTKNETYCFRLTNAGSITNFNYSVQPQLIITNAMRPEAGGPGYSEGPMTGVQRSGGGQGGGGDLE